MKWGVGRSPRNFAIFGHCSTSDGPQSRRLWIQIVQIDSQILTYRQLYIAALGKLIYTNMYILKQERISRVVTLHKIKVTNHESLQVKKIIDFSNIKRNGTSLVKYFCFFISPGIKMLSNILVVLKQNQYFHTLKVIFKKYCPTHAWHLKSLQKRGTSDLLGITLLNLSLNV